MTCPTKNSKGQWKRRLKVDDTFFEHIDTEEKAYWLGFIVGDGYVSRHPALVVSLKETDKEHIEKFKKSLKSEHPIRIYQRVRKNGYAYPGGFPGSKPYARLSITSRKLCTPLLKMGFGKKKTRNIKAFKFVPANLRRHFWRGLFDADGSIARKIQKSHSKYIQWGISLVGNRHNCREFSRWLKRKGIKTSLKIRQETNSPHCFRWGTMGNDVVRIIITLLWKDAIIFLTRKNELATECMTIKSYAQQELGRNRHRFTNGDKKRMLNSYVKNGKTEKESVRPFKTSEGYLYKIMKKRGIKTHTAKAKKKEEE